MVINSSERHPRSLKLRSIALMAAENAKELVSVLKGPSPKYGRRAGCIKLLSGNYELWCQTKRLMEIDTEEIKYDKMDMS